MAFEFKPSEPSGDALQRVAEKELENALTLLRATNEPLDERVHETRKHLKKLRALFALGEGSLGGTKLSRYAKTLRRAALALAELRSRAALSECFTNLERVFRDELEASSVERARALLDDHEATGENARFDGLGAAEALLVELERRLKEAPFEGSSWGALEPGFRHTYSRARKAYAEAMKRPGAETLHAFRTPAKRHSYQVQLLAALWPGLLDAHREELARLGDLLGDHHDLALLGPELEERGLEREHLRALERLIERRSRDLEERIFALGARLFAERPKAITRRFAAYFDAVPLPADSEPA